MKKKHGLAFSALLTFVVISLFIIGSLGPMNERAVEPPVAAKNDWTLVVDGLVQNPLNLTLDEILAMPSTTVTAKLQCVGDPGGGGPTAEWTGVPLKLILDRVGFDPKAIKVAFYAADGFTTDLTLKTAMRGDIIVAYKQDGEFLPMDKEAYPPLRLVVPGKWGYKWIKWIVHIQLVDYDFKGTYEDLGYSDEADIP